MERTERPFVHVPIDGVDAVVFDPDGRLDPELFDRYPNFVQARDAALTCIEIMLDEGDYDDEAHRLALVSMLERLDPAGSFEDLLASRDYQRLLATYANRGVLAA